MSKPLMAAISFVAFTNSAMAEDLGVKGQLYKIDRDAREQMKDQIRAKEKNGQIDKFWRDYRDKTVNAVKYPAPLGVRTDVSFRTELKDLKFVLPQDYRDEKGKVIAARGTVIEPLKIQPLTSGLIFIDGTDQAQINYAIAAGRKERLKIVLTAGSPYELRVKYKDHEWNGGKTIPFYYDQRKMVINQLRQLYGVNVTSVPAKLSQRGSQMQIEFGMRR